MATANLGLQGSWTQGKHGKHDKSNTPKWPSTTMHRSAGDRDGRRFRCPLHVSSHALRNLCSPCSDSLWEGMAGRIDKNMCVLPAFPCEELAQQSCLSGLVETLGPNHAGGRGANTKVQGGVCCKLEQGSAMIPGPCSCEGTFANIGLQTFKFRKTRVPTCLGFASTPAAYVAQHSTSQVDVRCSHCHVNGSRHDDVAFYRGSFDMRAARVSKQHGGPQHDIEESGEVAPAPPLPLSSDDDPNVCTRPLKNCGMNTPPLAPSST